MVVGQGSAAEAGERGLIEQSLRNAVHPSLLAVGHTLPLEPSMMKESTEIQDGQAFVGSLEPAEYISLAIQPTRAKSKRHAHTCRLHSNHSTVCCHSYARVACVQC